MITVAALGPHDRGRGVLFPAINPHNRTYCKFKDALVRKMQSTSRWHMQEISAPRIAFSLHFLGRHILAELGASQQQQASDYINAPGPTAKSSGETACPIRRV
jgi:hypothetical protein